MTPVVTGTCPSAGCLSVASHPARSPRYARTVPGTLPLSTLGQGKPVVNSEFGRSPYRRDRPGHMELGEVDTLSVALHRIPLAGRLVRPRLKQGSHLRDEGHQAGELTKTLGILDAAGADGASAVRIGPNDAG